MNDCSSKRKERPGLQKVMMRTKVAASRQEQHLIGSIPPRVSFRSDNFIQ